MPCYAMLCCALLQEVNRRMGEYGEVHGSVCAWVVLAVQDPACVFAWRLQAEREMIAAGRPGMSDEQVCAMLCYAMMCYAVLCYAMLCNAIQCYAMLCYVVTCYMPCCDVICCAVLCCVVLCHVILFYAMLCCDVICYAMLCYAVL
jgi:hypothetical protein